MGTDVSIILPKIALHCLFRVVYINFISSLQLFLAFGCMFDIAKFGKEGNSWD